MKDKNIIKSRTCNYCISYRVAWSTENGKLVLKGGIKEELRKLFIEIANDKKFNVISATINDNYVDLFITAHPKVEPSYMVKMLKGISARKLLINHPELQNDFNKNFWSMKYYLETIGNTLDEKYIKEYIGLKEV